MGTAGSTRAKHNLFKRVCWEIIIEEGFDDVPRCFGGRAKERRALTPAHLQTVRHDEFGVVEGCDRSGCRENVTKVPGIHVIDGQPPEAVLDVQFGKLEGM